MVLLLLWLAACGERESRTHGACHSPLSEYCDSDCPTLEEARACSLDSGGVVERTCEGSTIVDCFGDYGGFSYFFDESGALLAVMGYTDSPAYCDGPFGSGDYRKFWGTVPPEECW